MKTTHLYIRWFVIGMGHIFGISPNVPKLHAECTEVEVIGSDFRAVGNDLRRVMRRYPATPETAKALGEPAQLELAGIK